MASIIIMVLTILLLIMIWVMLYDSNRFVIRNYQVTDRRIKNKCRAIVISDLHNKSFGKENELLLAAIREQQPDMILLAGDILTAKPKCGFVPAIHFVEELAKDYPVYYGNGNHEHRLKLYPETYGSMAKEYADALAQIKVCPLVNAHVELEKYGLVIYGAEIDRFYYKRFKIRKMDNAYLPGILGQVDKEKYNILLAHNPDYFPQYAEWGADLTLSGHVHGGIVRVPFWGKGVIAPTLRLFPQYDGGIFTQEAATMVLSRGLGTHTIPVRMFNPGELWVIDFQSLTNT